MINRIIFFVESPFNQRDYCRFGIEILIENGFKVEIWDFSHILYSRIYSKILPPDPIDYKYQIILSDKIAAVNKISKLSNQDLVIAITSYRAEVYFIFRTLSKYSIMFCIFRANALPLASKSQIKMIWKILSLPVKKIIHAVISRIPPRLLGVNNATIILAGGSKSLPKLDVPKNSESKILWLHSLDYDLYLQERDKQTCTSEKYAVFLDEYLPFHPEYIMLGLLPPSSPSGYYNGLNTLFSKVENGYNIKVVIAAHPRSHYEECSDYFESRECIKGKTSELIKNAKFVIAHSSTAINFAVLYEKPIIFVTTSQINSSYLGPYIKLMSSLLGTTPINLDNDYDIDQEPRVDKQKFDYYRNAYIKMDGTEELPFWQMFSNHVKNMQ